MKMRVGRVALLSPTPSDAALMFRIVTASTSASTSTAYDDGSTSAALEDVLMEAEFEDDGGDGMGPSRAQAIGGGRVTGPGEAIADSGKWMR